MWFFYVCKSIKKRLTQTPKSSLVLAFLIFIILYLSHFKLSVVLTLNDDIADDMY